jgi:hypothetical protein
MAKESAVADSASTWMQVVFGGLGLSVAIVGVVIAYFAWVQPHSPGDDDKAAADGPSAATPSVAAPSSANPSSANPSSANPSSANPSAAAPSASAGANPAVTRQVPLGRLTAATGGGNVRPDGPDLVIACATGQSSDRQRTIEYDLLGNYAALSAELTVSKARDTDTPLQLAVFTDDRGAGTYTLRKDGASRRLDVALAGAGRLRLQLTCQFPDGEIRLSQPALTHA